MIVLIAYDIREDRTRLRVARTLERYGRRVQRSVFECELTQAQYAELKQELETEVEASVDTDSIRCYELCAACARKIRLIGTGTRAREPDYYLV